MKKKPHLFSIAAGLPFFPTLVEHLLEGNIIQDFPSSDPLSLSQLRIYTPTKRASRALRNAFVEHNIKHVSFLPDIRAVGDWSWEQFFSLSGQHDFSYNQPIEEIDRLLLLTPLVYAWKNQLPGHLKALFNNEAITIPSNMADAIWLARDLADLMDEMDMQGIALTEIEKLSPDFTSHWGQVTLDFLKIISKTWPSILQDFGLSNPESWRNKLLKIQTKFLQQNTPSFPVLAVGFPSLLGWVADLFGAISYLPQGAVVLPSIDYALEKDDWENLAKSQTDFSYQADLSHCAHPQYAMKKFLDHIKAHRSMIVPLGTATKSKAHREQLLWEALRPANSTEKWQFLPQEHIEEAFKEITLIEAETEREEALTLAIALRKAIEEKDKTAALITNDRTLARRVVAELKRFGIIANDSAGKPLSETAVFRFIRLLLDCVFNPGDPVAFLGFIKKPFLHLGKSREDLIKIINIFDLFLLRSGAARVDINHLELFVQERLEYLVSKRHHLPEGFNKETIPSLEAFTSALTGALQPLLQLCTHKTITTAMAARATIETIENLARDQQGDISALYEHEAKEPFIKFFSDLMVARSPLEFPPQEWPLILEALLAKISIEAQPGGHRRLFIWGQLEARLQTVDTVIIAGLNEGNFPESAAKNPFLSRSMKALLGLEPPEYKTGLAAYDFLLALGQDQVILSRSLNVNNEPSIASRWLQRLETIAGEKALEHMRLQGQELLHWARMLDHPTKEQAPYERPCPCPPLAYRPRSFSITEIESLQADPYTIYAKKVLKLKPLDKLICEYGMRERGEIYHKILADFISDPSKPLYSSKASQKLADAAKKYFSLLSLPQDIEALWLTEFLLLIPNYLQWELQLSPRKRYAEVDSKRIRIGKTESFLHGRADRIDLLENDRAEVMDFKTSSVQLVSYAKKHIVPQLTLEGALLRAGAFQEVLGHGKTPVIEINDLAYVHLRSRGLVEMLSLLSKKETNPEAGSLLCDEAMERLEKTILFFEQEENGYVSHAFPSPQARYSNYDHLARVQEWENFIRNESLS